MSPDDLQNIFYSGYPAATSWAILDEIFVGIDREALTYWSLDLVTKDAYRAICDSIVAIDGLGPQEKGHMALKQNVAWVGNIPYPFADETHLTLYIFARGDQYGEWRQEKISNNRAVFGKHHRK